MSTLWRSIANAISGSTRFLDFESVKTLLVSGVADVSSVLGGSFAMRYGFPNIFSVLQMHLSVAIASI